MYASQRNKCLKFLHTNIRNFKENSSDLWIKVILCTTFLFQVNLYFKTMANFTRMTEFFLEVFAETWELRFLLSVFFSAGLSGQPVREPNHHHCYYSWPDSEHTYVLLPQESVYFRHVLYFHHCPQYLC